MKVLRCELDNLPPVGWPAVGHLLEFCSQHFGAITAPMGYDRHNRMIVSVFRAENLVNGNTWFWNITDHHCEFYFSEKESAVFFKLHFPQFKEI